MEHEKVEVYGRADPICGEAVLERKPSKGNLSEDGNFASNALQLEEEIRCIECERGADSSSWRGKTIG